MANKNNSRRTQGQSQSQSQSRRNQDTSSSYDQDMSDDQDLDIEDATQTRRTQKAGGRGTSRSASLQQNDSESQTPDVLAAIQPAFQEVRNYIEGNPVRAAALGAIAGGLLMTIFATEKGRSFVRMAYDYANPVISKYARDYVSQAAGNLAGNALSQH